MNALTRRRRRSFAAAAAALGLAWSFVAEALPILPPDPAQRPPQVRPGELSPEALDAVLARLEPPEVDETDAVAEVPEPDSLLLLAAGLLPWGVRWHRQRCAQRAASENAGVAPQATM